MLSGEKKNAIEGIMDGRGALVSVVLSSIFGEED